MKILNAVFYIVRDEDKVLKNWRLIDKWLSTSWNTMTNFAKMFLKYCRLEDDLLFL